MKKKNEKRMKICVLIFISELNILLKRNESVRREEKIINLQSININ